MNFTARTGRGETSAAGLRRLSFVLALAVLVFPASAGGATYSLPGYTDTAVVTGLSQPTTFTWTPDGRMLILEKVGRVRIVVGGTLRAAAALDLSASVDSGGEKGLLGICLDAGFATNGFVYLYYTTLAPKNRISRFTMTGNAIAPASETVLLDGADATNGNHNGGTILIGPDGKLWAAPGDSGTGGAKSQDLSPNSFNGKVLRMELDGSAAAGNPFLGDVTKEPRIFAYGFRNPYRFTFRPSNGALFVADVGQSSREEIDVVTAGGNYGWPAAEGNLGSCAGCLPPVFDYDHTVGQAIIGGVFVTGAKYPALAGKYVFGDYVSSWIRFLDFDAGNAVTGTLQNLASSAEGPVCFAMGPDGSLYYAAINSGKIYRIDI
ncbi:MAG TPA: PQQ-dependent sugar dehydrogenase, partial [Thermoanaerobaculia bacterium]|nr:PQQ-dependent sugar dehydrogenase [Thermoanaerobaculia bacterium]